MIPLRTLPTASSTDTIGLLLECHERIRRFTRLAVRLASEPAPEKDVADAARAVHRYFSKALPLHVDDEDHSLLPRLMPLAEPEVAAALKRMEQEHRPIEEQVERLLPHWAAIAEEPKALASKAEWLLKESQTLEEVMEAHLQNEEQIIFEGARRLLKKSELDAISAEMRARRSPEAG